MTVIPTPAQCDVTNQEKQFLEKFRGLTEEGKKQALEYLEFLSVKYPKKEAIPSEPVIVEKSENESVIAAIKRLKKTYPMLESTDLLNQTSEILTSHLVKGKKKEDAINELEEFFKSEFEKYSG